MDRTRFHTLLALLLAFTMLALPATAQEATAHSDANDRRPTFHLPRLEGDVRIDGVLDDAIWQDALVLHLHYETQPGENVPPPDPTECRLFYDHHALYYGCRASDSNPDAIRARFADRDQTAFSDDTIGIAIDPFDTNKRSFVLDVNPYGIQNDRLYSEATGRSDSSWDAVWRSAGRITDKGYEVEAAIPFASLRFPRTAGEQRWTLSVRRYLPREVIRRVALTPNDRNNPCRTCQSAVLVGFVDIDAGRHLEVTPTLTGIATTDNVADSRDDQLDPGITARWGVTPNLALSATLNPDFSQVEADEAQLAVNQQFALFFQERRPFFLEGSEFFDSNLNAVHTRSVADPSWGLKATGKEGRYGIGAFLARDETTNLLLPGRESSQTTFIDRASDAAVLRVQRDVGRESRLGFLFTNRDAGPYENRVGGLDGRFRLGRSDTLTLQALTSRTVYPNTLTAQGQAPTGVLDDEAWYVRYQHQERNWTWNTVYQDIGDDFRADLGFLPQVGIRHLTSYGEYRLHGGNDRWFTSIEFSGRIARKETQDGDLSSARNEAWVVWNGRPQADFAFGGGLNRRTHRGVAFDYTDWWLAFSLQPIRQVFVGADYQGGRTVDFVGVREGDNFEVSGFSKVTLGKHLTASLSHRLRQLDLDAGNLFEANQSELRFVYQWNARALVRAIAQRTLLDRNTSLYPFTVDERTDAVFGQLVVSYKLNPETAIYIGYAADWFEVGEGGLIELGDTAFLKLSWAWRP